MEEALRDLRVVFGPSSPCCRHWRASPSFSADAQEPGLESRIDSAATIPRELDNRADSSLRNTLLQSAQRQRGRRDAAIERLWNEVDLELIRQQIRRNQ